MNTLKPDTQKSRSFNIMQALSWENY